jgi:hypothetical protein
VQSFRTECTLYTVKLGDNTFVLTPDHGPGAKAGQMLGLGWPVGSSAGCWKKLVYSRFARQVVRGG